MAPEANRLTEEDCLKLMMVLPVDAAVGKSLGEFIAAGTRVRPDLFSPLLGQMHDRGPMVYTYQNVSFATRRGRDAAVGLAREFVAWIDNQSGRGT